MTYQMARLVVTAAMIAGAAVPLVAQRGRGAGGAPPSPQAAAPIDLTGYWVSIVNEDWRWRMVTPPKGDYASIQNLMSAEGRKLADAWTPAQDGSCLAFGAANVMRMPTRVHITWEGDSVLKIDPDQGQQTRRFVFDKSVAAPAARSLQGFSVAEWERPAAGRGAAPAGPAPGPPAGAAPAGAPPAGAAPASAVPASTGAPPDGARAGGPPAQRSGNLKVQTTHLSGGWLRRNGVPHSEETTVTEYYDRFVAPDGENWMVVTTVVADPKYLTQEYVTSSHYRREPNNAKWDPTPCKAAS